MEIDVHVCYYNSSLFCNILKAGQISVFLKMFQRVLKSVARRGLCPLRKIILDERHVLLISMSL